MLPPRTVVRRSPSGDGPAVPSSATATALATRTNGAPHGAPTGPPMVFGAPAGSPHVVRRFNPPAEGDTDMSVDVDYPEFADFDNSHVDKTQGVGDPQGMSGSGDPFGGSEFRDAVLRIVEERLEEETERRAWRRGTEVF